MFPFRNIKLHVSLLRMSTKNLRCGQKLNIVARDLIQLNSPYMNIFTVSLLIRLLCELSVTLIQIISNLYKPNPNTSLSVLNLFMEFLPKKIIMNL